MKEICVPLALKHKVWYRAGNSIKDKETKRSKLRVIAVKKHLSNDSVVAQKYTPSKRVYPRFSMDYYNYCMLKQFLILYFR